MVRLAVVALLDGRCVEASLAELAGGMGMGMETREGNEGECERVMPDSYAI